VLDGLVIQLGVEFHSLVGGSTVLILCAVLPDPEVNVVVQLFRLWVFPRLQKKREKKVAGYMNTLNDCSPTFYTNNNNNKNKIINKKKIKKYINKI
jgi:hypothetical protein